MPRYWFVRSRNRVFTPRSSAGIWVVILPVRRCWLWWNFTVESLAISWILLSAHSISWDTVVGVNGKGRAFPFE